MGVRLLMWLIIDLLLYIGEKKEVVTVLSHVATLALTRKAIASIGMY